MGIRSQSNPAQSYNDVFTDTGNVDAVVAGPSGPGTMEASGGTTAEYTTPTGNYKSHTFTSSGSFVVTSAPGSSPQNAEFLVQGGGGGCKDFIDGNRHAGSGAGGLVYGPAGSLPATTYPVTIGGGGSESNGSNSVLNGVGPTGQIAQGGGAGGGTGGAASGQGTNNGPGTANVYRYGPTNSQTYGVGGVASDYSATNRNAAGGANTGTGASGYADGGSGVVVIRYLIS